MKAYYSHNQFSLVGKGWEIKAYLHKLAKRQPDKAATFLTQRQMSLTKAAPVRKEV